MFDTMVTMIGNVLNLPEVRRTNSTGKLVASFRIASTSRRYDKDAGRWVDGPSLRVRVTCWRRLAEGIAKCVHTGDPVIVTGRMYTRDWVADDGQHRVSYELEAVAVGHDLSRGMGTFQRHRPDGGTSAVEDAEADSRIGGETSIPVREPESGFRPEIDAATVLQAAGISVRPLGSDESLSPEFGEDDFPQSDQDARSEVAVPV